MKEAGVHIIYEYHEGSTYNVPTNIGFSHHYRFCEFGEVGMGDCNNDLTQVDRTVHKYQNTLLQNVKKALDTLADKCELNQLLLH